MVRELKAEIQELRTKVTEGPSKVPVSEVKSKPELRRRGGDTPADLEVNDSKRVGRMTPSEIV